MLHRLNSALADGIGAIRELTTRPYSLKEGPQVSAFLDRITVVWPSSYTSPAAKKWVAFLEWGLPRRLRVVAGAVPQEPGTVSFLVRAPGQEFLIAVDYSDYPPIRDALANSALVYFKMQFRESGYGRANVVPGGFVVNDPLIYRHIVPLRKLSLSGSKRYDVFGRFGPRFAEDIRSRAISMLQAQKQFTFEGSIGNVRYRRYLKECVHSRVCIDLPGNGDFCFRLVDYLALGCCVVAPKHSSRMPAPLIDGTHIAYCRPDLSDLTEVCDRYVKDKDARLRIRRNAAQYFDTHLHRSVLTGYYLRQIENHAAGEELEADRPEPWRPEL